MTSGKGKNPSVQVKLTAFPSQLLPSSRCLFGIMFSDMVNVEFGQLPEKVASISSEIHIIFVVKTNKYTHFGCIL